MDWAKALVDLAVAPVRVGLVAADAGLMAAEAAVGFAKSNLGDAAFPSARDSVVHLLGLDETVERANKLAALIEDDAPLGRALATDGPLDRLMRPGGLIDRLTAPDGVLIRLTAEGERIAAAARQMEVASHDIVRTNESISPQISGNVKISTTEGTGTFWLIPRLVELQRAYPGLLIDFNCTMNPADVSNLEADVSVQLRRPSSPDLKITKLGRLHTMPFAAQSYIDLFGLPTDLEDMARHRYALHISEQTQAKNLFTELFPGRPWSGLVAMTTNTASAHLWAISKGIGIGWLPTYAHLIGGRIVPIEAGPRFHLDVWLAYHPDVTKIARVRRVIDWIKESFDSKKFPWFGDEFIHPYDLPKSYLGQPLINLFEGFVQYPALQPNDFPGLADLQKPVQPEPTQT